MKSDTSLILGALCAITMLASADALSQTVITYDDGSTYTVKDNQDVYVSSNNSSLFKRRIQGKDTFFYVQEPWASRDYVSNPADDYEVGSHEWCKAYVPWSEGLTFDMVTFQRTCDTNDDDKYGCGDTQFMDDPEDSAVCG